MNRTAYFFIDKIHNTMEKRPTEYRMGQYIMNTLFEWSPNLYTAIVKHHILYKSNVDCYYDDNNINNTLDFIEKHWERFNKKGYG